VSELGWLDNPGRRIPGFIASASARELSDCYLLSPSCFRGCSGDCSEENS
jgi:hypothetical protein